MPEITSITYKPEQETSGGKDRFLRIAVERVNLIAGYGIEGDRKGGHPTRQLNIMCAETLDDLANEGYNIEPGQMGEQLIVRGMNIDDLASGTHLQMGETAVVEVTKPREGCNRLETIQGKPAKNTVGRIGVMARVVTTGEIRVGDVVRILQPEERHV